ncbi:MAG: riboflavin synthase subunit alpha, partial [Paenibacillus sp.]|nr:riboflavin synthase subunit alpha [Paenibacillus sp.]
EENAFTISIIPHTLAQTVLNEKQPGDRVNIEYDLLGKYIDRLLSFGRREEESAGQSGRLTMDFLSKHGFM